MKMYCLGGSYYKKKLSPTPIEVGVGIANIKYVEYILNVQVLSVLLTKIRYCPGDNRQVEKWLMLLL